MFAVGIIVVLLSVYSIWDLATAKAPTSGGFTSGLDGWNGRLSQIAPHVASGIVAACATVLANRRAPLRVVESEAGEAFAE